VQLSPQPVGAAHHARSGVLWRRWQDGVPSLFRPCDAQPARLDVNHATEPLRYAQAFADWLHDRITAHDTDALVVTAIARPTRHARIRRRRLPAVAGRLGLRMRPHASSASDWLRVRRAGLRF
jgi:hypothetical protein